MKASPLVPLVELLRAELGGYGGLLSLFDQQQALLWRREIQSVSDTSLRIEELASETAHHRQAREAWVSRFATDHAQPANSSLRSLLPLFPLEQQPLLVALIEEINHLLHRVRRRARQNHSILTRAVELHRDALATLHPSSRPRTYAPSGRLGSFADPAATLRAAG